MRSCELCESPARIYCESDKASLCWDCDLKVHGANFLVARHSRILLCQACQSPTPWSAAGSKLGSTVSICLSCYGDVAKDAGAVAFEEREICNGDEIDGGDEIDLDDEGDDDEDEDNEDEEEQDEKEEEGGNQVVPWSFTPPPPPTTTSSSGEEEFSNSDPDLANSMSPFSLKRKRKSSSHLRFAGYDRFSPFPLSNKEISVRFIRGRMIAR